MIQCPIDKAEERVHYAALSCCGCMSVCGIIAGTVTALTLGTVCGIGYLIAGGVSGISVVLIKRLELAKDIEDSLSMLKCENKILTESNQEYNRLNFHLGESITQLEDTKQHLKDDLDMLSESVKIVGETTDEFIEKLKRHYGRLKSENDRHESLNKQQASFQIMQLFKHFDANQDYRLSNKELEMNSTFLKSMFPEFDLGLFDRHSNGITFEQLLNVILSPK